MLKRKTFLHNLMSALFLKNDPRLEAWDYNVFFKGMKVFVKFYD